MVERSLPGTTAAGLEAAAARAKAATAEMSEQGRPIRYLRSTFVPGEDKCFCLFEAEEPEAVREAQERAEIPFERIVEALHIASDELA